MAGKSSVVHLIGERNDTPSSSVTATWLSTIGSGVRGLGVGRFVNGTFVYDDGGERPDYAPSNIDDYGTFDVWNVSSIEDDVIYNRVDNYKESDQLEEVTFSTTTIQDASVL